VVASLLVALGANLTRQGRSNITIGSPAANTSGADSTIAGPATTDGSTTDTVPDSALVVAETISAAAYDPFGTDGEHDELADQAIDGDFGTSWKTESYNSPLPRLKDGVGLQVVVRGPVAAVEIAGARDGTVFELYWAPVPAEKFADWTRIAEGTIRGGNADVSVPPTDGGVWLVWFTDLPATTEGTYTGAISEVRFRS
jgi:hypothetical protein